MMMFCSAGLGGRSLWLLDDGLADRSCCLPAMVDSPLMMTCHGVVEALSTISVLAMPMGIVRDEVSL